MAFGKKLNTEIEDMGLGFSINELISSTAGLIQEGKLFTWSCVFSGNLFIKFLNSDDSFVICFVKATPKKTSRLTIAIYTTAIEKALGSLM